MADVNRGNRPLSPFMLGKHYRLQLNSVTSLLHRVTGVGMALAALLIVWWFLAAAAGPDYFAFVDGLLTSWLGLLILFGSLVAFWYHFWNGIRHLRWDMVKGLGIGESTRSGYRVLALTVVMTVITLILAL